jgi:hypothetical protein
MRAFLADPPRQWGERQRRVSTRLNPADYGFNVTIGIAARTADQQHIYTVSDRRLSFGPDVSAADNALLKDHIICKGWGTLFAANDTSFALPIIHHAAYIIHERKLIATETNVRHAMCEAYAVVLEDYVARVILRKFGFKSLDDFRNSQAQLGRNFSRTIARRIDRAHLFNTEFLVYGFDAERKTTHLFHVEHPGLASSLDHMGYYAIGAGAKVAMNFLHLRTFAGLTDEGLLYRLVEAKFAAETADTGVGRDTTVITVGKGESVGGFFSRRTINEFRRAYETWLHQPPDPEVLKLIQRIDIPS